MSLNVVLMFVFSWLDPGDPGCASMRILPQLKRDCNWCLSISEMAGGRLLTGFVPFCMQEPG